MKIMSVVGARPQFVKLAPIAHACDAHAVTHIICHTGQHYDPMLSDVFFSDLGIPAPDVHLGVGSGSHGVQTGAMLAAMDEVLAKYEPDWVLVYGDTNSTLAAALAAAKLHIPVAHLEAGLRSFNRDMPEEVNRVLTDHCAELLLAPTTVAASHLEREGLDNRTVVVGDVMTDVLMQTRAAVEGKPSPIMEEFQFQAGDYSLATIHRPANTDDPEHLEAVFDALGKVDHPVVILAHPRLVAKAKEHGLTIARGNLMEHAPLAYPDLVSSVLHARGVITDSGGLQKEAFLLRTPCTTVRSETEWVETIELGWNVLADATTLTRLASRPRPADVSDAPYGDGQAANRSVQALIDHFQQASMR